MSALKCFLLSLNWRKRESRNLSWQICLLAGARGECFEPRDRVFTLHSLHKPFSEIFPLDYEKPLELLLLEAVSFLVNHDKELGIRKAFCCSALSL